MNKYVFDTNILLSKLHLLDLEGEKILPIIVLHELDSIKSRSMDQSLKYAARQAVRKIKSIQDEITFDFDFSKQHSLLNSGGNNNDDVIIECAKKHKATVVSEDYLMQLKAKAIGLEVYESDGKDKYYKGYTEITPTDSELAEIYTNVDLNIYNLLPNQYLIIKDKDNHVIDKLRWSGDKLVKLKLPNIKGLKSKHYLQECAMDLLYNTDITTKIILGTYGSGKTYLSTKISLHHVLEKGNFGKLLVVREPIGEGKEIGFLKGTKNDKTADFFKPIEHSLDGSFFQMEALEANGTIEKEVPYFLKGTTYNQTVIMVDEAEDLSYKQLKLVGTRVGQKSNIVYSGDYKQAVYDDSANNGLIQLVNKLKGNPLFGVVDLVEDVRSETSKMFAELG